MGTRESWLEEARSAYLYRVLTRVAREARERELFGKLAEAAQAQAAHWLHKSETDGVPFSTEFVPDLRTRTVAVLARVLGPRRIRAVLAAAKVRGLSIYSAPVGHPQPTSVDDIGKRHRGASAAGNLRAAVFGANDGLVSNASLVLGMAGAAASEHTLLVAGTAGLLAGACSMAAGEYVSVRSQREMLEKQLAVEREELREYPDEEAQELALIYQARGIEATAAREAAERMLRDPETALDALAREELGVDPSELGSPFAAAAASFLAFAVGAVIPLLPFLVLGGRQATLLGSAGLSAIGLFGLGAAVSLFTGRSPLFSGLRMVAIGSLAGAVTFTIGHLVGVSVG